jgi:soluble lytic murein transglycosylase-like protein
MRSVYALIPAALLAGTVLSAPAEAKRTEDPTSHSERVSAQKKYFKTTAQAKKPGKLREAQSLRRKTRKTASSKTRKTASVVKHRNAKSGKVATASVPKKRKIIQAAAPKTAQKVALKMAQKAAPKMMQKAAAKIALFDKMTMTKTLRSGPRVVRKLITDGKAKSLAQQALRIDGQRDIEVTQVIREMAPSYGVPTWFALRIANVESGYNPYARGRAGEIGIYQLKCQTARGMGFSGDCLALTDVRTNVHWGLKHLSLAIASSGGNLRLAASKHNGGLGRKSLVHSYIAKVF